MNDQTTNFLSDAASTYGPYMIVAQLVVIVFLVGLVVWLYRNRKLPKRKMRSLDIPKGPTKSLGQLIDEARSKSSDGAMHVELDNASYTVEEGLKFDTPFKMKGKGVSRTKIVATGDQPAIRVDNAKDCEIEGVHIEGSIQCNSGELNMDNCHIDANKDGVCIEAFEGSVVKFSGTISSEGGIAIHARGESKVILKPPYNLRDEDYIVVDPKSKLEMEPPKAEDE